jgi:hypothetical protein
LGLLVKQLFTHSPFVVWAWIKLESREELRRRGRSTVIEDSILEEWL